MRSKAIREADRKARRRQARKPRGATNKRNFTAPHLPVSPGGGRGRSASQGKGVQEIMKKQEAGDTELASGASLEKVRDMLFGVQMRDYDKRFTRLEERMVKEVSELKDDLKKRLAALEVYIKKEVDSLEDRLKSEQETRGDQVKEVSRELKDNAKAFEKKTSSLDDQLAKSQKELRQQILELHKKLSDELRDKAEEILATLSREAQELRNDKADRAALASLLTEMAMRLNDQFRLPAAEGKE